MEFLADESCDIAVVVALRSAGHDVTAIVETDPGAPDDLVLSLARAESRVVVTEDKDFGVLAYAGGHKTAGVIARNTSELFALIGPTDFAIIDIPIGLPTNRSRQCDLGARRLLASGGPRWSCRTAGSTAC